MPHFDMGQHPSSLPAPAHLDDMTREWPAPQDLYPAKHRPRPHPTVRQPASERPVGEQTGVIRVSQLPPRTQPGDGFTRIINPAPTVRGAAPVPAPTVRPSRQPRWMFLLGRFWARVRGDR